MSDIEKRDLEAHVVLCAERYKNLENKLDNLEQRTSHIEQNVMEIKEKLFASTKDVRDVELARAKDSNDQSKVFLKYALVVIGVLISLLVGVVAYDFQRIDNALDKATNQSSQQK